MKVVRTLGVIAAAGLAATSAQAAGVLQFDVNSITAAASGPFSTGFTGSVALSSDSNSTLAEILINGTSQNIAAGQLGSFTGTIMITAGVVTGGSFSLSDTGGNTYSASIQNGSGLVKTSAGQTGPFTIDGLTFMGMFNSSTFAGVDVTAWDSAEPLGGSFLQFTFGPTGPNNTDTDADIDIFVVVPLPAPAGLATAGLIGLAAVRRRR